MKGSPHADDGFTARGLATCFLSITVQLLDVVSAPADGTDVSHGLVVSDVQSLVNMTRHKIRALVLVGRLGERWSSRWHGAGARCQTPCGCCTAADGKERQPAAAARGSGPTLLAVHEQWVQSAPFCRKWCTGAWRLAQSFVQKYVQYWM
jgi:hypothetical protein